MSETIDDLTTRVRRWVGLEELLFETLGRWARELPEPPVKRVMATWCHRHAWHAELWRGRLPVIPNHHADDEGDTWLNPLRDSLARVGSTGDAIAVLFGPVLQALEDAVNEHRDAIDPRVDGPTARILDLVSADLDDQRGDLAEL